MRPRMSHTKVTYSCRGRLGAGGREVACGDNARSAENQHKDDRARCEVVGVEFGIKPLTKWLTRDEAQKAGLGGQSETRGRLAHQARLG